MMLAPVSRDPSFVSSLTRSCGLRLCTNPAVSLTLLGAAHGSELDHVSVFCQRGPWLCAAGKARKRWRSVARAASETAFSNEKLFHYRLRSVDSTDTGKIAASTRSAPYGIVTRQRRTRWLTSSGRVEWHSEGGLPHCRFGRMSCFPRRWRARHSGGATSHGSGHRRNLDLWVGG